MVHLWNDIFLDFLIVNCHQTWPVRNDNEIRYLESISFTCLQRMKPDFCCWKYVWAGVEWGVEGAVLFSQWDSDWSLQIAHSPMDLAAQNI